VLKVFFEIRALFGALIDEKVLNFGAQISDKLMP
jgi:hypothetical protein